MDKILKNDYEVRNFVSGYFENIAVQVYESEPSIFEKVRFEAKNKVREYIDKLSQSMDDESQNLIESLFTQNMLKLSEMYGTSEAVRHSVRKSWFLIEKSPYEAFDGNPDFIIIRKLNKDHLRKDNIIASLVKYANDILRGLKPTVPRESYHKDRHVRC